jgi:hypothetical protein
VDESQFALEDVAVKGQKSGDGKSDGYISSKQYHRRKYPWLTEKTARIKDIHLYLHSEIIDFVDYVSPS